MIADTAELLTARQFRSFTAIERQLLTFIEKVSAENEVDLIVCGERKGTAVMRALIQEIKEPRFKWEWRNVLSTNSMSQFNWSGFDGKRILLFEELVHHGRSLKSKKEKLEKLVGNRAQIKTAGFAVWDRCEYPPDFCYYASVDADTYEALRNEIVQMLQKYGSLLLDTEHIELSVKIDCGINEFYRELARAAEDGNTFSFLSSSNRLNLTIQEPDIIEEDNLGKWLTPGSNTKGVVQKCRIIERDHSQFSIMPIFYPNTRCVVDNAWIRNLPAFIDKQSIRDAGPKELFYLTGLLASIELLKGVVLAMTDLLKQRKIRLEIPQDSFLHLCAMFPRVDMDSLWHYVRDMVFTTKLGRPKRSSRAVSVHTVSEEKLKNMSSYLVAHLLKEIDKSETDAENWEYPIPRGKSRMELNRIIDEAKPLIDVDPKAWGVVTDRLIDGGMMVTTVEEVISSQGDVWAIRTFLPDSEIVSEKLRRHMAVRGLKWLPVI